MADIVSGGVSGGIEQFIARLTHALGALDDGDEEYILVTGPRDPGWIRPYLGRNQRVVVRPWASWRERLAARLPLSETLLTRLRQLRLRVRRASSPAGAVAASPPDPFLASLAPTVVHFTHQRFAPVPAKTIFNPHDLLHRHHPEVFTPEVFALREALYIAWCQQATLVAADTPWVKDDLAVQYDLPRDKVRVVPFGGQITESHCSDLTEARLRLRLPERFTFYPAQTWPHKNHIRLVEALALLRDRDDLTVNLVCTGLQNEHWPAIQRRIDELGLRQQVRFLGFVSPGDLRALYRLAEFVTLPSLFEGAGIPVLEAFAEGAPLTCSNTTSLPAMAGNAALFFDPLDVESIADALRRMTADGSLRQELARRGSARLEFFTWERTARTYRALYRQLAGLSLSAKDQQYLDAGERWPD